MNKDIEFVFPKLVAAGDIEHRPRSPRHGEGVRGFRHSEFWGVFHMAE